jgi:hypothetical protein
MRRRMHEVRRRTLLQGVRGGLQEVPRRLPGDAALRIAGRLVLAAAQDSRTTK